MSVTASINCVTFDSEPNDKLRMTQLLSDVQTTFSMHPAKKQMRHTSKTPADAKVAAKGGAPAIIPLAVPQLPQNICERPEIIGMLRSHLLPSAADDDKVSPLKNGKVIVHGEGGVGKVVRLTTHSCHQFLLFITIRR